MITPSRWFAGGKGLDDFRSEMLNDKRLEKITDFVDSTQCFIGVAIAGGVSYFLWNSQHDGKCTVTTIRGQSRVTKDRFLNEYDIFVRNNSSIDIINRINARNEKTMEEQVSSRNVFGLSTDIKGHSDKKSGDLLLACSEKSNHLTFSYVEREQITKNEELLGKYKVCIGRCVPRNGETGVDPKVGYRAITTIHIFGPDTVFTDTYIYVGVYDSKEEAENLAKYLSCKFTRFLLHETYSSMNVTKGNFRFVPLLDMTKEWTDEELYERYNCTDEEIDLITSMMRPMEYVTHYNGEESSVE